MLKHKGNINVAVFVWEALIVCSKKCNMFWFRFVQRSVTIYRDILKMGKELTLEENESRQLEALSSKYMG